jgi:5-carboxymethyl-2-hydroxymuconate isomerase
MPHLTLEYTSNLATINAERILLALNHALAASGHFNEMDIKSRAMALDTWRIGTTTVPHAFVHVKLAILSGRSPEVKSTISNSLLRVLSESCKGLAGHPIQLCVEMLDIDRASYAKEVLNADAVR